MKYCIL